MRMRSSALVLLVLALLAQASVPWLHAQNWARTQSDNGVAYAFCGKVSPALLARMKAVAPKALYQQVVQADRGSECKLCLVMGVLGVMLGAAAAAMLLLTVAVSSLPGWRARSRETVLALAFNARAPPHPSFL